MADSIRIVSERVLLRTVRLDDAKSIYSYRSDAVINQYQGWIPKTLHDVENFIKNGLSATINFTGTWYQLAIIEKKNQKLIGDIGIHFLDADFQVEIGFTLDRHKQGKGYATEAVKALINYLFDELNKRRIIASIDPRNEKSVALVERLGFRKEAHFKESLLINGEWVDDLIYAVLKEEWLKMQKS